jgi:uncharacterized membrane protein
MAADYRPPHTTVADAPPATAHDRVVRRGSHEMTAFVHHLRARPHLMASLAVGAAATLLPGAHDWLSRGLLGWNVAVWLYLALAGWTMLNADHARVRRVATAQAEGADTVLVIVILATLVSLGSTVVELSAAKAAGAPRALPHLAFALATVLGSWLLLPTVFALTYASLYFQAPRGEGLRFPEEAAGFSPDFADFLYFSFTIAVACQTADVGVSTRRMRRWVLLQALLSFAFNTAILAFTINMAASLF